MSLTLGPFELLRTLGGGGLATVHEAVLTDDRPWAARGTRVALKTLRPEASSDPTARRAFELERAAVTRLRHPHVVRGYEAGVAADGDGRPVEWLALELLQGTTLAARLAEGRLAEPLVRRIGAAVASALSALHDAGFVHGDVKPSNVFLREDGSAVLLDPGIGAAARELGDEARLTELTGTASHAAPEILRGRAPSAASDAWALGAVLREAVAGSRDLTLRLLEEAPDASALLDELVAELMRDDPRKRLHDVSLVASVLETGEEHDWWWDRLAGSPAARAALARQSLATSGRSPFGGRAELLASESRAALASLSSGGPARILVGAGGLGKTRLLREIAASVVATRPELRVVVVNLAHGLDGLASAARAAIGRPLDERLRLLIPDVTPGGLSALLEALERGAKSRDASLVVKALRALANEAPLAVILDDLHASPEAARATQELARMAARPGMLLLASARPGSPVVDALVAEGLAVAVGVEPLGPSDAVSLVSARLAEGDARSELARRVASASGGSPLHAQLILDGLAAAGMLEALPGGRFAVRRIPDGSLAPPDVRDSILARVAHLPPGSRELAELVAFRDAPMDLEVIGDALGADVADASEDLQALVRSGLLRGVGATFVLDHALIGEVLRDAASEDARRLAHRRLVAALAPRARRGMPSQRTAALVALCEHAIASRDEALAAAHVPEMSKLADLVDPQRIARVIESALALFEGDDVHVAELLVRLASILPVVGRMQEWGPIVERANAAAAAAGDERLVLLARCSKASWVMSQGDLDESMRLLEGIAERLAHEEPVASLRALRILGHAYLGLGRLDEAQVVMDEQMHRARAGGFAQAELMALMDGALVLSDRSQIDAALARLEAAVVRARELADGVMETRALCNVGSASWRKGDMKRAREFFEAGVSAATAAGDRESIPSTLRMLGCIAWLEGRLDDATRLFDEAFSRSATTTGAEAARILNDLAIVRLREGRHDAALALAEQATATATQGWDSYLGGIHYTAGCILLAMGRVPEAIARFEAAWDAGGPGPEGAVRCQAHALLCLAGARSWADADVRIPAIPWDRLEAGLVVHLATGSEEALEAAREAAEIMLAHLSPAERERAWSVPGSTLAQIRELCGTPEQRP